MDSKVTKLAILRENNDKPCPFGLDVTSACGKVGDLIHNMAPISILGPNASYEEKEQLIYANKKLINKNENQRCPYADKIIKHTVECSFGENLDSNMKENSVPLPAPYYAKNYNNTSYDGSTSIPIGYFADYDMSRNMYYALYSLQADFNYENCIKFANYIDQINVSYDFYNDGMKLLLTDFANSYTNKSALLKKATHIPEFTKVFVILNKWKKFNQG